MITVPPSVGVPRLVWWASGRSIWMSCPRPRRRKARMASGVPTRPRARATAAAMRMPTTPLALPAPGAEQALGHHFQADHPARLDQDHVGGPEGRAEPRDGGLGVGGGVGLLRPHALHAGGVDHHPAQLADPDQAVDAEP